MPFLSVLKNGQKKKPRLTLRGRGIKEKLGKRSESYTLGISSFPPA